jgi:hypothetical protein
MLKRLLMFFTKLGKREKKVICVTTTTTPIKLEVTQL